MYINTNIEKSFANFTVNNRLPAIIEKVLRDNNFDNNVKSSLLELKDSIPTGKIEEINESPFSFVFNQQIRKGNYTWDNAPFFLVEHYFYYKLYEITNFKVNSIDYFKKVKEEAVKCELEKINQIISSYTNLGQTDVSFSLEKMIKMNLLGNKVDLSQTKEFINSQNNITCLVDDTTEAYKYFNSAKRIDVILDNAGIELLLDLLLCCFLLDNSKVEIIYLHFKSIPYFVSDAMVSDLEYLLSVLDKDSTSSLIAQNIRKFINSGNIIIKTDDFWCSSQLYSEMPKTIKNDLLNTDLLINKGDLNYRKLVGDNYYNPTDNILGATSYLPFNCLNIRVLKSEVALGISRDRLMSLRDKEWMYNGKYALIQLCKKNRA